MSFHLIIKQILSQFSQVKSESKTNNIFNEFLNLLSIISFTNKKNIEIKYNISGEEVSLYELKHVILRRNRVPPHSFFKPAKANNTKINFLEGNWEDFPFELRTKILCLCIDPSNLLDDIMNDIIQPLGICFSEKTFEKDLDNSFHLFVKENIWIDNNNSRINIPFFLKEYLYDLDNDENSMINMILKEIYKDPFMYKEYRKMEIKMSAGKIFVRYYKEYDKSMNSI